MCFGFEIDFVTEEKDIMKKSVKILTAISIVLAVIMLIPIVLMIISYVQYNSVIGNADIDELTRELTVVAYSVNRFVYMLAVGVHLGIIVLMWGIYGIVMLVKNQKHKNNIQTEVEQHEKAE